MTHSVFGTRMGCVAETTENIALDVICLLFCTDSVYVLTSIARCRSWCNKVDIWASSNAGGYGIRDFPPICGDTSGTEDICITVRVK